MTRTRSTLLSLLIALVTLAAIYARVVLHPQTHTHRTEQYR